MRRPEQPCPASPVWLDPRPMTAIDNSPGARGGLWAALFAVWALLVQTALPMPAAAQGGLAGVTICTQMGAQAADGGASHPLSPASAECRAHCLAAVLAFVVTPTTVPVPQRLAWTTAAATLPSAPSLGHDARAPPRPPGQGPPSIRNA